METVQPVSFFSDIRTFTKDSLKPTTTIVRGTPVVDDKVDDNIVGAPTKEEVIEYFDTEQDTNEKAAKVADLIKSSKHLVVYTGAGISTAAKIPDYRGPQGVWTLRAQGKRPDLKISLEQALPTYSHMALVTLMNKGYLKYIVSTNVDGLHRRSGIPEEGMAELHGNIYREICNDCDKEYLRLFDVTKRAIYRFTGRLCNCGGRLRDSIINFGENLPEKELKNSILESKKADLTWVIGSSMRVSPACELPSKSYKSGGKFCLLNLQKTSYDAWCERSGGVRIHTKCDEFMKKVMENLGLHDEVPEFMESEEDLTKAVDEMIEDPNFGGGQRKYNVYCMADDGPPPKFILKQIQQGLKQGFNLSRVDIEEKQNPDLGKVRD